MSVYLQCRLCARWQITNELINIKKREAIQLHLESKIQQCLHLDFENPLLPSNVCLLCSAKVTATYDFQELVKKAQQCLLDSIAEKKPNLKTELPETGNNSCDNVETLLDEYDDLPVKQEVEDSGDDLIDTKNIQWLLDGDDTKNIEQLKPTKLENDNIKTRGRKRNIKNERVHKKLKTTEVTLNPELAKQKADRSELIRRHKDAWKAYKWKCVVCLIEISSLKEFRIHFSNEHKQNPKYICNECLKVHDSYPRFKKHVRAHRNKFKHKCEVCSRFFHCNQLLKNHLAVHSTEKKYTCPTCGKSYGTSTSLKGHLRTHQTAVIKVFECEICNKKLQTRSGLLYHKKSHLAQKDFTCDQCGKTFATSAMLNNHFKTLHSNVRSYSCEQCPRTFKTQQILRAHIKIHSDEKQHACEVCGKRFGRKESLKLHSTVHTGVLAFVCEYCNKGFRLKSKLKVHIRQHTGERPYSCTECNHHFTDYSNYLKHMKGKHGVVVSRRDARCKTDPPAEQEKLENNT